MLSQGGKDSDSDDISIKKMGTRTIITSRNTSRCKNNTE